MHFLSKARGQWCFPIVRRFCEGFAASCSHQVAALANTTSIELASEEVDDFIANMHCEQLTRGSLVYLHMVRKDLGHFETLAHACRTLVTQGLLPVPHVPASRFDSVADFRSVLQLLTGEGGARHVMVVGGNDQMERTHVGKCAYPSAGELLKSEVAQLKACGVQCVALPAYPEGHPGLGHNCVATTQLLVDKTRTLLEAGIDVAITTQFCFNALRLVAWLRHVRGRLEDVSAEITARNSFVHRRPRLTFNIGIPGPTPRAQLQRAAEICGVFCFPLPSAFDIVSRGNGLVQLPELHGSALQLGLCNRGDALSTLFARYCATSDTPGLQRSGFAMLLAEDAESDVTYQDHEWVGSPMMTPGASDVVARSVEEYLSCCSEGFSGASDTSYSVIWPEELVWAIASHCERDRERFAQSQVALHVFPLGGRAKMFELLSMLRSGVWPPLSQKQAE